MRGWASVARTIELESTGWISDAVGNATIKEEHINVEASGLKPNSVYTVWFVNTEPKKHETGAGTPPYMFRTDDQGEGR